MHVYKVGWASGLPQGHSGVDYCCKMSVYIVGWTIAAAAAARRGRGEAGSLWAGLGGSVRVSAARLWYTSSLLLRGATASGGHAATHPRDTFVEESHNFIH